jgi:Skp family chaperone for outer membrane proteins
VTPIAFSNTQPAAATKAGASTSGPVRGTRPGALTAKEKEEHTKLQAELSKLKEELAKAREELKTKEAEMKAEREQLSSKEEAKVNFYKVLLDKLGWKAREYLKKDAATGKLKKRKPEEFVGCILEKLQFAKVSLCIFEFVPIIASEVLPSFFLLVCEKHLGSERIRYQRQQVPIVPPHE